MNFRYNFTKPNSALLKLCGDIDTVNPKAIKVVSLPLVLGKLETKYKEAGGGILMDFNLHRLFFIVLGEISM